MLCHPDVNKSCASCCGLYNKARLSKENLESALKIRTNQWMKSNCNPEAYKKIPPKNMGRNRYKIIQNCIYIAFVDKEKRRVGCLLYEGVGKGELRNWCPYGKDVAEKFVCPAHELLSWTERQVVFSCVDDWFLYGLLIADPFYLKKVVEEVECELGCSINIFLLQDKSIPKILSDRLREKLKRMDRF